MLLYSLKFFDPKAPPLEASRYLDDVVGGGFIAPVKSSLTPAPSAWYSRREYLVTAPGPYR
jgi:hypothetical protein